MKIKRFNEFGKANLLKENTELINSILDKISKLKEDGKWIDMEKSLTDYERSVLKSASEGDTKYNTMEEDINSFLDEKFGNLTVKNYERTSFGFPVLGYYFIRGEKNHLLLNLELSNNSITTNTLYVDYRSLKEIKDRYGLEDKDLYGYIKKWFMSSYIKELPLPYNFEIKKISLVF